MQTRLTHTLSFLLHSLSSHSVPVSFSLSPSHTSLPGVVSATTPTPNGLIVLHLFIQAFMATLSSRGLISSADDRSLPRLSLLFIIGVQSHHISLTLGRWFSHWTTSPYNKSPTRRAGKATYSKAPSSKRRLQTSAFFIHI